MAKQLPVIPKRKLTDFLPISVDILCFGWNTREIQNIETEEVFRADVWSYCNGSANLNNAIKTGVMKGGKRIFGYEAMADRLTALGCAITPKECEELVKRAVEQRIQFVKLMKTSDWTTSPDRYEGENRWEIISDVSGLKDSMDKLLGAELRKSKLRLYVEGKPNP